MGDAIAGTLLILGVLLFVLAGVGLHRLNGVIARMHAATKPATLGLVLVLAGTAIRLESSGDVMKLVLVAAFQLITAPVAAHLIARAVYRAGLGLGPTASVDELREVEERALDTARDQRDDDGDEGAPPEWP